MKYRLTAFIILALAVTACASDPVRQSARLSEQLAIQTEQVAKDVIDQHQAGTISDTDYLKARVALDHIADCGLALDAALRALDAPTASEQIQKLLTLLNQFATQQPAASNPVVKASLDAVVRIVKALQGAQ